MIIVNKSTDPVGTADMIKAVIQAEMNKSDANHQISVISNPEFLKKGSAIYDCISPDRDRTPARPVYDAYKVLT